MIQPTAQLPSMFSTSAPRGLEHSKQVPVNFYLNSMPP